MQNQKYYKIFQNLDDKFLNLTMQLLERFLFIVTDLFTSYTIKKFYS